MFTLSTVPADRLRIARFGAVGFINTAIGYAIIVAALLLGYDDLTANVAGYAAGLFSSYTLNSRWTFRDSQRDSWAPVRFVTVFFAAYGANLAVVLSARHFGWIENPLVHLAAVGTYSGVFYLGSKALVFRSWPTYRPRTEMLERRLPEVAIVCSVAAAWLVMRDIPVSHDVVWQMWIARQLLGGADLYGQIMELNPPLWFWMAVPAEWVAQRIGANSEHAIIAFVFVYACSALLLLSRLIADLPLAERLIVLSAAGIAALYLPLSDFAQREHLTLLGAVPYLALAARRADNLPVGRHLAVATGVVAALGFALKHYFVVVPILLECWLILRRRKEWRPLRPETVALGCCATIYATAILLLERDYLTTIVPMLNLAYDGYESSWRAQIFRSFVLTGAFSFAALFALRAKLSSFAVAATLSAIGFTVAYFAQQKGFRYHSIPVTGILFLGLGPVLYCRGISYFHAVRAALVVIAMGLPLSLVAGPYVNPREAVARALLEKAEPGTPVVMLTANPVSMWPMVEHRGHVWPSRHFAFWMLNDIARQTREEGRLSPDMKALADAVRQQTVVDLDCYPPDLILVDDLKKSKARGFDALAFFLEDREFQRLFEAYRKADTLDHLTAYVRIRSFSHRRPANCRSLH